MAEGEARACHVRLRFGNLLMLMCGILMALPLQAQSQPEPTLGANSEALHGPVWGSFQNWERNMPEWYHRLEDPIRTLEFDLVEVLYGSGLDDLLQRTEYVSRQVEAIIAEADIWRIDLEVDGIATRMVRALRERADRLVDGLSRTCPMPGGTDQDAAMDSREREVCVCFLDRGEAENAVRRLDGVDEAVSSDAELWDRVAAARRERMMIDYEAGRTGPDNRGFVQDNEFESTRDQWPFRTFTLQNTGEEIELWIAANAACLVGTTSVRVKWTNLEER